ncbi:MAG: hypothetical protein ED557_03725 [Balneola sp.]|nr:MAG: hypothetical protein ED557_03725 [Balneola sp.]
MRFRETILTILLFLPTLTFAQIENRWQPDSVYANKNVKRIIVYLNSPKDLSEIVDFDKYGKRIRSVNYSASYNRATRNRKRIQSIKLYNYDSLSRLISIVDSLGNDSIIYQYGVDGNLKSSIKKMSNTIYSYEYFHAPLRITGTRMRDSTLIYKKTREYEKNFYVKRFYGYYFDPTQKRDTSIVNGEINITSYFDYTDLQRFEDDETIKNTFGLDGRLIKSEIRSVFMNDRINEYELHYKYYKNGLLKSVVGYVPRYFKYEFWE